jgi:hypothetical protein
VCFLVGHIPNSHVLLRTFDEADEYCPHCDNKYIIDAKTPAMVHMSHFLHVLLATRLKPFF